MDYYDEQLDGRREQLALEAEAEAARVRREARLAFTQRETWEARQRIREAATAMYTSEPLAGVQSPFYAGDRYFADAEDARRARLHLTEQQRLQVERLTADARERIAAQHVAERAA